MKNKPKYFCHPYFKFRKHNKSPELTFTSKANMGPYTVPQLCSAYNWPTDLVGGSVIAIIELGGGWVQSDMDLFFESIGQPLPQLTDVSVDGTTNNPNQNVGSLDDPDYEVALDIQVASAAYYLATGQPAVVRVYWANDIAPAVAKATSDGCDVCSISWGADEADWGNYAAQQMDATAQAAVQAGMVVFAASGDNDSSDGGQSAANVDLPSSCPHVIGCGGTTKTPEMETVWNWDPGRSNGTGTGGGYSTISYPTFSKGLPLSPCHITR